VRRVVVAAVLAALSMLVIAASAPAASSATTTPTTFTDPLGDGGTAADISAVKISNDDRGQYTFDVAFATPYGDSAYFYLYLDTDRNASTGDPAEAGADYSLFDDHATHSFDLNKWDGSRWVPAPSVSTVSVVVAPGGTSLTVSLNRSDLSGASGFNFVVYSVDGDGSAGHYDDAPSGTGMLEYTLRPTLTLSLGTASAGTAKAGKPWVVAVVVNRSDTGASVGSEGMISCQGSSGSTKLVTSLHAFISGGGGKGTAAVCGFAIPKSFKHKVVSGTVSVTLQGQTFKKVFTTDTT
jgi:hypothetical protein